MTASASRSHFPGLRIAIGIVIGIAAVWVANSVAPAVALASQAPIASYSFNEDEGEVAHDDSGNGHEGEIQGAEWVEGKYGSALQLEPWEEDLVTIPDTEDLRLTGGAFTLEAWVKPRDHHYWTPIISKLTDEYFSYALYVGGREEGVPEGFISNQTWVEEGAAATAALPLETWSNVALTSDGETLRLYVNGELVGTGPVLEVQDSEGPLQLGGNSLLESYFDGALDEVRIYDRALDQEEVEEDEGTAIEPSAPPSVVHARIFSGDPDEGGHFEAEEWAELASGQERRQTLLELETTTVEPCPEEAENNCAVRRRLRQHKATSAEDPLEEEVVPLAEMAELSPAGTLLLPGRPTFGSPVESGPETEALETWQVPPPGAGSTFELITSEHAEEEELPGVSWSFWVDTATGLPLKAEFSEGGDPPAISYYTYGAPLDPESLAIGFWTGAPSEGPECLSNTGGLITGPSGGVFSDPSYPSVVYSTTGTVALKPLGAAADGAIRRARVTEDGVKLEAVLSDLEQLEWEVPLEPNLHLSQEGSAVTLENESEELVATITASNEEPVVVEDESGAAATIVVEPGEGSVEVAASEPIGLEPCGEEEGEEPSSPTAATKVTAAVTVFVNPYPAVGNVKVSLQGPCTDHEKYLGADNKVVFGGCKPGETYTISVPENVITASHYVEPHHVREFTLPSSGHTVEFHYTLASPPPPPPPPPPSESEEEPGLGTVSVPGYSSQERSEDTASSSSLLIPPGYVVRALAKNNLHAACTSAVSEPEEEYSAGKRVLNTDVWSQCGPLNVARIDPLVYLRVVLTLERKVGALWFPVARLNKGKGISFVAMYPPFADWEYLVYPCADSSSHYYRSNTELYARGVGEVFGKPIVEISDKHLSFCG